MTVGELIKKLIDTGRLEAEVYFRSTDNPFTEEAVDTVAVDGFSLHIILETE